MVPLEFQLSSEDSSSSEELPNFVQNPKLAATEEIEIEDKSTHTETPISVRKTYIGESSKIKNPPTQEEMAAMLEAVHKLIDEMIEKTTPSPPPVS